MTIVELAPAPTLTAQEPAPVPTTVIWRFTVEHRINAYTWMIVDDRETPPLGTDTQAFATHLAEVITSNTRKPSNQTRVTVWSPLSGIRAQIEYDPLDPPPPRPLRPRKKPIMKIREST